MISKETLSLYGTTLDTEIMRLKKLLGNHPHPERFSEEDKKFEAGCYYNPKKVEVVVCDKLEAEHTACLAAREKIDNGTYDGLCSACGVLIDENRLEAHPEVTMCITCKAASDRQKKKL